MWRTRWCGFAFVRFLKWGADALQVDKLFNPLTLLVGPCLVSYLIYKSTIPVTQGGYHLPWWYVPCSLFLTFPHCSFVSRNILGSYMVWLSATRTAKLLPHLWYRPQDIIYVPAFILFGYYFAIMKIYALFTLHEVRCLSSHYIVTIFKTSVDRVGHSCRDW